MHLEGLNLKFMPMTVTLTWSIVLQWPYEGMAPVCGSLIPSARVRYGKETRLQRFISDRHNMRQPHGVPVAKSFPQASLLRASESQNYTSFTRFNGKDKRLF
jgi:hypothetical protein